MLLWLVLGFIAAVMGILISEAMVMRVGKLKQSHTTRNATALIGMIILVLMVIGGMLSFAVVIGFIISYSCYSTSLKIKEMFKKSLTTIKNYDKIVT